MVWLFLFIIHYISNSTYFSMSTVNYQFLMTMPWVVVIVGIWFIIAYFSNTSMIRNATGAYSITRMDNPRIYNIVENLTLVCGMDMPKINIIDDPQLNAFASGIDKNSYTVTVTTGLLNLLDDEELAGVIGHELTHIRNRDTRLLITSIVFVGILATLSSLVWNMFQRNLLWGSLSNRSRNGKNNGLGIVAILGIAAVICFVGYFFTMITRFAISRKREYMADAGGAELCGNPLALASALRKISGNPGLQNVKRDDVAQLFIIHPQSFAEGLSSFFSGLFATHPDTAKRIAILEQF
jgi:heat shock protein HtpX